MDQSHASEEVSSPFVREGRAEVISMLKEGEGEGHTLRPHRQSVVDEDRSPKHSRSPKYYDPEANGDLESDLSVDFADLVQ